MTKLFNVSLFREMHVQFYGIKALSPERAAAIARAKSSDEADYVEDCNGFDLGAVVDEIADDRNERTIVFSFVTLLPSPVSAFCSQDAWRHV